jgi:hypothetical protein
MIHPLRCVVTVTILGCLGLVTTAALADDDRPYTEGPVVKVDTVRTEYGRFDDYVKFLDTSWKKEMDALKSAGLILNYEVLTADPQGPNDPDIYLVITYKNWAAFDGLDAKERAILKNVYGSVETANQGAADRAKMRRTIGTLTMQAIELK